MCTVGYCNLLWSLQRHLCGCQGAEAKDVLIGRVFGYAAVVRSGRLVGREAAGQLAHCLQQLATLAAKRSYLHESAASVVLAALQPLKPKALGKALSAAPAVLEFMQREKSPEVSLVSACHIRMLPARTASTLQLWPPLTSTTCRRCLW